MIPNPPLSAPLLPTFAVSKPLFSLALKAFFSERAEDFADALAIASRERLDPVILGRLLAGACQDPLVSDAQTLIKAKALLRAGAALDQTDALFPASLRAHVTHAGAARQGAPLFWAVERVIPELAIALLDAGADPLRAPALCDAPLSAAIRRCDPDYSASDRSVSIALAMIERCDPERLDPALWLAVHFGARPVALALIERGRDPFVKLPGRELSAMDLAEAQGRHELAGALRAAFERRGLSALSLAAPRSALPRSL